jgi:glycosyltransferase involved in cell wall biosynthesis
MKAFIHFPKENWIVDRIAQEFCEDNSDIVTTDLNAADVIWAPAGWCIDQLAHINKPIISTVHHIVEEKPEQIEHIIKFDHTVTAYHVPNVRTLNSLRKITDKPITVIPYWIQPARWHQITPNDRQMARTSLGIDTSVKLIGSFQRDTEGSGNMRPKLEKGPDIFCDYVERVANAENVCVLLTGYRRQYVINRMISANIKTIYIENAPAEAMKWLYGALDLYVVSSRCEGGPQALLECAALGVPIISTPVGLAELILSLESVNSELVLAKPNVQIASNNIKAFYAQNLYFAYRKMLQKVG